MTKHIFITGGVVSSLGKGITAASIALLLKRRGYRVRIQKLDPYLNVDPGTMSPYQHGEVYVTDDGAETDLDLGHYERFAEIDCSRESNFTTGSIYSSVIARERRGEYLGKTVQVIPHITDEIKQAVSTLNAPDIDIAITEIGGTAGDIESLPFLEALRQYRHERAPGEVIFMHLTLVPYIKAAGELKTKPSQQSVGILRGIGIVPDILVCRCERPLGEEHFEKLALFCNVRRELVFEEVDVANTIYEVPLEMAKQDIDKYILELFGFHVRDLEMSDWRQMVERFITPAAGEIEIAVVGKYISLQDAYKSIFEALDHGANANSLRLKIRHVEAENLENDADVKTALAGTHGILVPGGFGVRGIEGKIMAIRYARENKIPFLGICLGMQCAVIEFARNACGLKNADSTEFNSATSSPVIDLMEEQKQIENLGGTMRLGAYPCNLAEGSKARQAYGKKQISERHRHRYEFNNKFTRQLAKHGMTISGVTPSGALAEIVEIPQHPWFVACQFHPEFKSRPLTAHPLFRDFTAAAMDYRNNRIADRNSEKTFSPREKCGLCGICGSEDVLELTHLGLHAQQHRGQEAAGIMLSFDDDCVVHADKGLVDDVFNQIPENWRGKTIKRAISHVRYGTAGTPGIQIAQPLMVDMAGQKVGIAHNGTISNAQSLRRELQKEGAIFQTAGDTELILHLMAQSLIKTHHGSIWHALESALQRLEGAYCLLLMTKDEVVAVRDPYGFRPLCIADFSDGGYMIASETIAFNVTDAKFLREVEPGEMIIWNRNQGMESRRFAKIKRRAHCIFEHVYFARPGSMVFGDSVRNVRKAMGRKLAEEAPVIADVVMPVPDSGMFAALGYAEASGLPFDMGFTRNHYVGRTFIDPGLVSRRKMVTRKLQPIAEAVQGKRICLIEDSIVRGSTSRARISTLREAGAKEVHMRISCPPHRFGCYFGIDFPEPEKLIANQMDIKQLTHSLRLDSLAYLSCEGMLSCVSAYKPQDYCCACFNGQYPVTPARPTPEIAGDRGKY